METEKFKLLVQMFWIDIGLTGEPVFRNPNKTEDLMGVDQSGKGDMNLDFDRVDGSELMYAELDEMWWKFLEKIGEGDG